MHFAESIRESAGRPDMAVDSRPRMQFDAAVVSGGSGEHEPRRQRELVRQQHLSGDVWTPLRPSSRGEGSGTNYTIIARVKADPAEPEPMPRLSRWERLNWPAGGFPQAQQQSWR